ncbi:ABC transporter ATP-binding protein [Streptomyces coffeae]|uniref:ABC transporter ATP-binding protein n=1 Tax=Streptomyces coffeae TaxID=621382 RepID=A0ABS1NCY8_9ACTN|nr:ABC transporter ATP-binding protein [Streptomyces coffeae]MBL1097947.1 ABC transporter ATP-binding protein [Streptomyces coffeae]
MSDVDGVGTAEPAVEVRGLARVYDRGRGRNSRQITALDRIDLTVARGEIRGLLGPNGAGKTTLCKILCTVLLPSAGSARVLGHDVTADPVAVKKSVGVVFGGDRGLYGRLDARANLNLWGALHGVHGAALHRQVDALLERVGLADRAEERVDGFSRGMKQRLHLARGMVADPQVLLLDEPTSGMDPVAAHDFRSLVEQLRLEGRTVLLTTHDMAEAEAVCDQVTLMDKGTLLATERPSELSAGLSSLESVEAEDVPESAVGEISELSGVADVKRLSAGRLRVDTESSDVTRQVLQVLVNAGVTSLGTVRPSLEDVYLHYIGRRGMAVRS